MLVHRQKNDQRHVTDCDQWWSMTDDKLLQMLVLKTCSFFRQMLATNRSLVAGDKQEIPMTNINSFSLHYHLEEDRHVHCLSEKRKITFQLVIIDSNIFHLLSCKRLKFTKVYRELLLQLQAKLNLWCWVPINSWHPEWQKFIRIQQSGK